mmetsp:Transcript_10885/g.33576  ORF Transcript_10885/g.33576 Transcript_10885/m.33576 type:complete len:204 (+) Transcript_10885:113-724(+)
MGLAEIFRSKGLSMANCGFLKLNAIFPVMLGLAHATVAFWCKSDVSASVVAAMPGDEAKVPLFVAAFMPLWSIILSIVALQALAAVAPNGYESQRGRAQKAPGEIERAGNPGWIERVQSAQYNNWESTIGMICSFYVATELKLSAPLFAKLATLFFWCRIVYPIPYALDVDMMRTQIWLTGLYATAMVAFAALFPDTIIPLLT